LQPPERCAETGAHGKAGDARAALVERLPDPGADPIARAAAATPVGVA